MVEIEGGKWHAYNPLGTEIGCFETCREAKKSVEHVTKDRVELRTNA